MMEKREFYASTVEEAVNKAARDLGIEPGQLSYRVVDEGNSGFLGIGARDARVEVDAPAGEATTDVAPMVDTSDPDSGSFGEPLVVPTDAEVVDEELDEQAQEPAGSVHDAIEQEQNEVHEAIPQELLAETEESVASVLDAMGFEARVDVYDAGGYVAVDVAADNTALIIGQKCETIDALKYLVNAGLNKRSDSRVRVVLDAEGYRQRRVEALQGMAHRTARKAVREDRTIELPPMNPSERRVVHLFLRDNPGVTTESEGAGSSRRVRVSPA